MNYEKRLIFILAGFAAIVMAGTLGYGFIEQWGWFDALYMTLITLTTVGYGETHPLTDRGRLFTMVLLIAGVGFFTLSIGTMAEFMVEGRLRQILGRRKMVRKIEELFDHYIVCGYGRLGSIVGKELQKEGIPFVVIETDGEIVERLLSQDMLAVQGNAADDSVLIKAGIKNARGLVTVLKTDADNVFVSLTSRVLNPDLFILARAEEEGSEQKLTLAGADKVISPYAIGGQRMALAILKPAMVDFIELATQNNKMQIRMEDLEVRARSRIKEKSLREMDIRTKLDIIVIAIRKKGGEMLFNPSPDTVIYPGDHLIAMGDVTQLQELEDMLRH